MAIAIGYVMIVVTPIFVSWWGKAIDDFLSGKVDRFVVSVGFCLSRSISSREASYFIVEVLNFSALMLSGKWCSCITIFI